MPSIHSRAQVHGPASSSSIAMTTSRRTKSYTRQELSVFELMGQPVWVFDIEKKAMWWANQAALELWDSPSLKELLERDFEQDMSPRTAQRLCTCLKRFERGERFSELWHFTPNGKEVLPTVTTVSGIGIEGGRMAMLVEAAECYANTDLEDSISALDQSDTTVTTTDESSCSSSSSRSSANEDVIPVSFVETTTSEEVEVEEDRFEEDISLLKIAAERSQSSRALRNEDPLEPVQVSQASSVSSTSRQAMGVPVLEAPEVVVGIQRQPQGSSMNWSHPNHMVLKNWTVDMDMLTTSNPSPGAFAEAPFGARPESLGLHCVQQEEPEEAPVVVVAYVVEQNERHDDAVVSSSTSQQVEVVYTAEPVPDQQTQNDAAMRPSSLDWTQATIGLLVGVALGLCVPVLISSIGKRR